MMSFNYAHWVTMSVASVCSLWKHKQLTHLISGASEINKFIFFWTLPPLFSWVNRRTFFGRALSRWHMAFFRPLYFVLDAFLKKRMELPIHWKLCVRCWRKPETLISRLFNVIELYVIKSWWKIKFNKRKVYHQLVRLFFFSFFFVN